MSGTLQPATPGSLTPEYLDRTLGVFFIGYMICLTLYGFTFFQTYAYFLRYPKDNLFIRATVATLCALDTLSSALISHALYYYLVKLFPYTQTVDYAPDTFCAHFIATILAVYVSQVFYSHRVFAVTKNYLTAGAIGLLSTIGCAFGLATGGKLITNRAFADLDQPIAMALNSIAQGATALSALFIFAAMYLGFRPSPGINIKPFESWWDKWIALIVSRGGAATASQFACFVSFVVAPSHIYWIFFHLISTKLFVVSALTALNCRETVNGRGVNEEDPPQFASVAGTGTTSSGPNSQPSGIRFQGLDTITVEITRSTHSDTTPKPFCYDVDDGSLSDKKVGAGGEI